MKKNHEGLLDNIVKIPLAIDEKRIEVRPNYGNEFYEVKGLLVQYGIFPAFPELSKCKYQNIGNHYGRCTKLEYHSLNKNKSFEFWMIDIWVSVPKEFRDIIFFHELIELQYMERGIIQPKAHKKALIETEKYIKRNLNDNEKKYFEESMEKLKKVELTPEDLKLRKKFKLKIISI